MLNGGADVFRCIAAEWKSVDPETVTDNLRQQAKQVELCRREINGGRCLQWEYQQYLKTSDTVHNLF